MISPTKHSQIMEHHLPLSLIQHPGSQITVDQRNMVPRVPTGTPSTGSTSWHTLPPKHTSSQLHKLTQHWPPTVGHTKSKTNRHRPAPGQALTTTGSRSQAVRHHTPLLTPRPEPGPYKSAENTGPPLHITNTELSTRRDTYITDTSFTMSGRASVTHSMADSLLHKRGPESPKGGSPIGASTSRQRQSLAAFSPASSTTSPPLEDRY